MHFSPHHAPQQSISAMNTSAQGDPSLSQRMDGRLKGKQKHHATLAFTQTKGLSQYEDMLERLAKVVEAGEPLSPEEVKTHFNKLSRDIANPFIHVLRVLASKHN